VTVRPLAPNLDSSRLARRAAAPAGLAVAALLMAPLVLRAPAPVTPPPSASESPPAGAAQHEIIAANHPGGYEFSYPSGWQVGHKGVNTTVTNPAGDVAIAIGPAPRGKLRAVSFTFARQVRSSYDNARIDAVRRESVGKRTALVVTGHGTNSSGVRLRWATLTIRDRSRNLGVAVFTDKRSEPEKVMPGLHLIVGSLHRAG
jgi:hypothetical protein